MRWTLPLLFVGALFIGACTAEEPAAPGGDEPAAVDTTAPSTGTEPAAPDAPAAEALPEVRYYRLDTSCPYCREIEGWLMGREGVEGEPVAKTYAGRITFKVDTAYDALNRPKKDAKSFDFGSSGHGLVGLEPSGEIVFKIDGHHFNRAQALEEIEKMLARK